MACEFLSDVALFV